ncbi:MAG: Smr/MutS family protein [Desulfobacterales bacterium]|jgi:DNA-nicking Smr family endonuclease|nr:Smr/MutS family protein [Desulfobacterales bacterium]MDH4010214.1 Smr/MutS family protein [Desulfobacterales bacterium]
MKSFKPKGLFRPFEGLKTLLEAQSVPLKKDDVAWRPESAEPATDLAAERALFEAAMADVERITQNICAKQDSPKTDVAGSDKSDESETLLQLQELVETGKGFVVADTPEYVEGIGYNVNREVAKRLHNGEFSIQGYIDLHGLSVESAREAFENFLKESIATGKRMVLIIHGRGLSSPAKPILKTKVIKWLTTGRWRKWIIAFTSARLCDGGAGATYLLLRKRPASKRYKKGLK